MNPIKYIARFHRERPMTFGMAGIPTLLYGMAIADAINSSASRGFNSYELAGGAAATTVITYAVMKIEKYFPWYHDSKDRG